MTFRNLTSGNLVSTTNEIVISIMKDSPNYEAVKQSKGGKKDEGNKKGEEENTPPAE